MESISSIAGGGTACEEEATEGSNLVDEAGGGDFAICGSSTHSSCIILHNSVLTKRTLWSLHRLQSWNLRDILLADPRRQAPKRKIALMVILHLQDCEHDVFAEAEGYTVDDSIKESESAKSELTVSDQWP
jgi:hypothetical protein